MSTSHYITGYFPKTASCQEFETSICMPSNTHIPVFTVFNLQRNCVIGSGMARSLSLQGRHQPTMQPTTIRFPRHRSILPLLLHHWMRWQNPSRLTAFAFLYRSCKCKEPVSGLNGPLSVLDGMLIPSWCFWILHCWGKSKASHCNGPEPLTEEEVRGRTETSRKRKNEQTCINRDGSFSKSELFSSSVQLRQAI